jgi:hypothetical protein
MADFHTLSFSILKDPFKNLLQIFMATSIMVVVSYFLLKLRGTLEGLRKGYEQQSVFDIEKND